MRFKIDIQFKGPCFPILSQFVYKKSSLKATVSFPFIFLIFNMYITGFGALLLATGTFVSAATTTSSSTKKATSTTASVLAVESPTWLPNFPTPQGVNSGYPTGQLNTSSTLSQETLNLSEYPEPWTSPSTTHPEIKAVIAAIDWSKVPKAPVRKTTAAGDIDMSGYDDSKDEYCWWSSTNCVKPKASFLPEDISYCPNV